MSNFLMAFFVFNILFAVDPKVRPEIYLKISPVTDLHNVPAAMGVKSSRI